MPLVAGILVFLIMTAILREISQDVINHERLTTADVQLSNWLHVQRNAPVTTIFEGFTLLGSTAVAVVVASAFGFCLIWKRRFRWLVMLGTSVLGGALLNRLLKYFFHRPRPQFDDPILRLTSYSFPSGHTMLATVLYGVIAAYLISQARNWRQRALIAGGAGLLILLVGFSRIYLGAHYLSDVLGALAEGLAWLTLCLTVTYFAWPGENVRESTAK
jgi:membrane-associated phospholipid phosphatase